LPSDPVILGFDTSAAHCAAALLSGKQVLAEIYEEMGKGQAQRLMPMVEEVMAKDGMPLSTIDAVAVGIGPGNFTGIRISVSAARGLALALGVAAIGVSGFEIMRGVKSRRAPARQLVSLEGPRGGLYVHLFEDGREAAAPAYVPDLLSADWAALGVDQDTEILGHLARDIRNLAPPRFEADGIPAHDAALPQHGFAVTLCRIAADKLNEGLPLPRPAPLYIRPADAAPSREGGPVILPA